MVKWDSKRVERFPIVLTRLSEQPPNAASQLFQYFEMEALPLTAISSLQALS